MDEGESGQSPSSKGLAAVKERCKAFNSQWEALHSSQSTWSIPDVQLKNAVKHFIHQVPTRPHHRHLPGWVGCL